MASVDFMFVTDFSAITLDTVTKAVGHAFFSLGVGVGVMLTLGAYMEKSYSIGKASLVVGIANAVVSIVAGLTIFAIARSEEHTSELQSLMRISSAVFCLKKKKLVSTHK